MTATVRPKVTWWFSESMMDTAARLDDEALHETISMVKTLSRLATGRATAKNEPPVYRMWKHHPMGLHVYGCILSMEASGMRGMDDDFYAFSSPARELREASMEKFTLPPWYEDEHVIMSHRATAGRESTWAYLDEESILDLPDEDHEWLPMLWPIMTGPETYELRVGKADREALAMDDLWLPDDIRERVVNLD